MTNDDYMWSIRTELANLALTVHRLAVEATNDQAAALTALADIEQTVVATRRAILELPSPDSTS